jgi:gliding motility-associated lipoprotein GldD
MFIITSCGEDVVVKPKALLHLQYPEPVYRTIDLGCPFSFELNAHANVTKRKNCWINLVYPNMKATIHLTYREVEDNLDSLLYDAQKLTFDHTIKASAIFEQPRVDSINKVYGMLYMISGNAATSTQFYVTDSLRHFITGSLYFKSRPNFDSILPAISYLRDDIRTIMESIEWK